MTGRDETYTYQDLRRIATYRDDAGTEQELRDKNGEVIRLFTLLVDKKYFNWFYVDVDTQKSMTDKYSVTIRYIPKTVDEYATVEYLSPDLAIALERV